ncbi:MAG TPA: hypothetical protein VF677_04475 [Flavobacterium sp.]
MTTTTILLLLLSIVLAGCLSYLQYFYKVEIKNKIHPLLAFLRFITIFGILLLLINPKITRNTFEIQKTPLPVIVDNSSSVKEFKATETALALYKRLTTNKDLQEKFEIQSYQFDNELQLSENFNFSGTQTNLEEVAKNLKSINKNRTFPSVIITDGNQTTGNDYVYSFDTANKVYPIVVGDTTTFLDLKVSQVNVNKYAFHKNEFPAEVFLSYSGNKSVTANFTITQGNSVLTKQAVSFSPDKRSAIVNILLPANTIGLQVFKATVASKEPEKNTYNNTKNFAVEIIDQKSSVAIISSISHPDIGALKRAIETNAQRKVTIAKPSEIKSLSDYNVLILYQPTSEFRTIFDTNKSVSINTFIITGVNTDFNFLNQQQNSFEFRMSYQKEDYLAAFDTQFNLFAINNIGFDNFPPLQNTFGTITTKGPVSVLLSSKIRNINTNAPLLAFTENSGKRNAFLFGENSWKWRMQNYVDTKSFDTFDVFIDKIIQFLSSANTKKSLIVTHESFYNSGEPIVITAQYFNKNYEFDEKARLSIAVTNKKTKQTKNYDLLKGNNAYKVNLDGLAAGQYTFAVKELNSKTVYNSFFEILDFDIEKQFVNPDVAQLQQLASQTNGQLFMPDQADQLIKMLLENQDYKAIQKSITKKIPLIDSIWLLILIAITLASEWLIRKYYGML